MQPKSPYMLEARTCRRSLPRVAKLCGRGCALRRGASCKSTAAHEVKGSAEASKSQMNLYNCQLCWKRTTAVRGLFMPSVVSKLHADVAERFDSIAAKYYKESSLSRASSFTAKVYS